MADPTDPVPNPAGERAPGGPGLADVPPSAEAPQAYQPLSLLAVGGLVLSAVFALVVIGGGVMAFAHNTPWLLPPWVLVLPLAGAALSWVARGRINASEGTLGGSALANWGVGLSVFFGVTYVAYYAATYFAVTRQARAFVGTFLDELKAGKTQEAYLLTTPPPRPTPDAALREKLEMMVNPASMPYGRFGQMDFVRMIQHGGGQTRIEPAGVIGWEWDKGGYLVKLRYRVQTPLVGFDLDVATLGKESPTGDYAGRQWYVVMPATRAEDLVNFTPEGEKWWAAVMEGRGAAQTWAEKMMSRDLEGAYFGTLPAAERKRQEAAAKKCKFAPLAVAGPAALFAQDAACRDLLAGETAFFKGDLVRADPKKFWARDKIRAEVLRDMASLFSPEVNPPVSVSFSKQARMPAWEEEGGRLRLYFDVEIMFQDLSRGGMRGPPKFAAEGQLVLESPAPPAGTSRRDWRVEALELLRASVPDAPRPPQRPRPPGPPPQQ